MLLGLNIAQTCLKLDETPKGLLVTYNNSGTMSPSKGPDTYHGQG